MSLEPMFEREMVDENYELKLRIYAHLALKIIYK
jgi:hypothetical protein